MWEKRIRQCELADPKFREREWKRIKILTGLREWDRKSGF
jgi:hypothetical protein